MRRVALGGLLLCFSGCNCISLVGATCTLDDECGKNLACINGCCGGCDGTGGGGGAGGGTGTGAITFVSASGNDSTTSNAATFDLTRPANLDAGDLLVAIVWYTVPAVLAPTGFTRVRERDVGCGGYHAALYSYVVPAQDLAAYTFSASLDGGTATSRWAGAISAYRGASTVSTSQLAGVSAGGAPSGFAIPSVSGAANGTRAVVLFQVATTLPLQLMAPAPLIERWDSMGTGIFDAPSSDPFDPGRIVATDNGTCQANIGVLVLQR